MAPRLTGDLRKALRRLETERIVALLVADRTEVEEMERLRAMGLAFRTRFVRAAGWCYEPTEDPVRQAIAEKPLPPGLAKAFALVESRADGVLSTDRGVSPSLVFDLTELANRGLVLRQRQGDRTRFVAVPPPQLPGYSLTGHPIVRTDGTNVVVEHAAKRRRAENVRLAAVGLLEAA